MINSRSLTDIVAIGSLLKPHGVKGEIVATLDRDVDLEKLSCILLKIENLPVPFFITAIRRRSAESYLITIDGIDNETVAAEMTPADFYALRHEVAGGSDDDDTDGMTADELIGFILLDGAETVGEITGIQEITADNWLFEVKSAAGTDILVPIADELIEEIDTDGRRVVMALPAGLY